MDQKITKLLTRGVDHIYPSAESLQEVLTSGKKLRVYFGIDPTGAMQLHHTIPLHKLRHFQDLGHQVILLIGSFTAMIGDPTGKSKARVPLTKEQVLENARNYTELARAVLNFEQNPPEVVFNGEWLSVLTFEEVVRLAAHFTVSQMMERDMFQERIKQNLPISLHEFLYPLMQGYDSVATNCDVEIGGTDQTFNMLAGRQLVKDLKGKEKFVVTVPLLTDDQGKKTSTSDGTGVPLTLSPNDLYGKIMSLPDGMMPQLYALCTNIAEDETQELLKNISDGGNPMQAKKRLAYIVTEMFHGEEQATLAQRAFETTVQGNALPEEMPTLNVKMGTILVRDLLVQAGLCSSNADAKRMIEEHAVTVYTKNREYKVAQVKEEILPEAGLVIRVGKRQFIRLQITS